MTLLTTCQTAAQEIGIKSPISVVGSSDTTARRLYRHARRGAEYILRRHNWTELVKRATINSTGATIYTLPSDFQRMLPDTLWNGSDSWRLIGHLQHKFWENRINGWAVSTQFNAGFRIVNVSGAKQIEFDPAPDNGDAITFAYMSDQAYDSGSGLVNAWDNDGYSMVIGEYLAELQTIWRVLRSVGRDYQEQRADAERELRLAIAQDAPAETLKLGGLGDHVLLTVTPETGYG